MVYCLINGHKWVIHLIANNCNTGLFQYFILGEALQRVDDYDHLGVEISHNVC